MRTLVFVLTLLTTTYAIADDTPIKPNEIFMYEDVKIQAPSSDGWALLSTSKAKIGFIAETEDQIKTAQVSYFSFSNEYQREKFIAEFKGHVSKMGKVISETYSFFDTRGYPCVKAASASDMGRDGNTMIMQFRLTACVAPIYKQQGVMMAFSYISDQPISTIDKEADIFFEKVEIPLVNMKPRKEDLTGDLCTRGSAQLVEFMRAKGNGLTREGARKAAKQNPDELLIPAESINNLYDYPTLDDGGHFGYFLWACIARKEGRKPLPLSNELVAELEACFKKGGNHICGTHISDRVKAGI